MKKILVIDDEQYLTSVLDSILEKTGLYEVFIANDGQEGIDLIKKYNFDLIFLDYIMPKVRGDKVLQFVREHSDHKHIKVIIMSGLIDILSNDVVHSKQCEEAANDVSEDRAGTPSPNIFPIHLIEQYGIQGVLEKPFARGKLLSLTQTIFEQEKNGKKKEVNT